MKDYLKTLTPYHREIIKSARKSRRFLQGLRLSWPRCPGCGERIKIPPPDFGKRHWCPHCRTQFTDFSSTLLAYCKLPYPKIILGAHLFIIGKSARQAAQVLNVNYKSAHRLFYNIRLGLVLHHYVKGHQIVVEGEKGELYLKRGFDGFAQKRNGPYRRIAPDNKLLYLKEQEFRYTQKDRSDPQVLERLLGYLLQTAPK